MIKQKATAVKDWYFHYEHYLSPVALVAGFIFDNLTLTRIDLWIDNLVILVYLSVALTAISFLSVYDSGRLKHRYFFRLSEILPFVLQFVLGGLFSVFTVFYSRSGSVWSSWPFLFILVFFLIGNELFRERYLRFTFRLGVYYVALFSYSVFAVPILLHDIGVTAFLIAGLASLLVFGLVIMLLYWLVRQSVIVSWRFVLAVTVVIYLVFQVMYFTNLIPPVPLSLKENGIYHQVRRSGSGYRVSYEKAPWYQFWQNYSPVFHWQPGTPVFAYSSVFAPTNIATEIYHRWSYFDEDTKRWTQDSLLSFPITGGRDGGYRGYSYKYGVRPGRWRVEVVTGRGQVLGRMDFTLVQSDEAPELFQATE